MGALAQELGIHLSLFLAQAFNFLVVLALLSVVLWRPLMKIMHERDLTIRKGLTDAAHAAEVRKAAEGERTEILEQAAQVAREKADHLIHLAHEKESQLLATAQLQGERIRKELDEEEARRLRSTRRKVLEEGKDVVREVVLAYAKLNPKQIDDALLEQAIKELKKAL